jgi:hypothetical protein
MLREPSGIAQRGLLHAFSKLGPQPGQLGTVVRQAGRNCNVLVEIRRDQIDQSYRGQDTC